MKLEDLENIEDYYIDNGILCIKLISGDHLRINFNSIEAIKKQLPIQRVSKRYYHDVCGKCTLVKEYEHSVYGIM